MFDRLESSFHDVQAAYDEIGVAYRKVTQFTADASHELRTPIAVLRAMAEVSLRRELPSREYRRVIEQIAAELEHASHLVDSLMTLARSDCGSNQIRRIPMDLQLAILQACREGRALAAARRIAFRVDLPEDGIPIEGDAESVQRLFMILIDNAVKYTQEGGQVRVSLEVVGDRAIGRVADTGIGIAAEEQELIFDRFYRADKSRSRHVRGTGLGLSIARWTADAHGARIEVDSHPGQGSTFSVIFPVLNERSSNDETASEELEGKPTQSELVSPRERP